MRGCGHADIEATKARKFKDPRSYVSTNLNPATGRPKEFLHGDDKKKRYAECYTRDKHICVGCGEKVAPQDFAPHHVKKRSQGGDDSLENLVTLHQWGCHMGGEDAEHPM